MPQRIRRPGLTPKLGGTRVTQTKKKPRPQAVKPNGRMRLSSDPEGRDVPGYPRHDLPPEMMRILPVPPPHGVRTRLRRDVPGYPRHDLPPEMMRILPVPPSVRMRPQQVDKTIKRAPPPKKLEQFGVGEAAELRRRKEEFKEPLSPKAERSIRKIKARSRKKK